MKCSCIVYVLFQVGMVVEMKMPFFMHIAVEVDVRRVILADKQDCDQDQQEASEDSSNNDQCDSPLAEAGSGCGEFGMFGCQ